MINPAAYPTFALAVLLFWLGVRLARKSRPRSRRLLSVLAAAMALPCLVCDLFYFHLFDRWVWFYEFRAAPWSELTLAGAGLIAGMLYARMEPDSLGEKLIVPVALIVVLGAPFSKSALAPVDLDRLQPVCTTEVCLQSTMSTCGPTSAATILKLYGQSASEKELAREAYTYRGGTEGWYLARAIRRRGLDAEFVIARPDNGMIPAPSIAGVRLPGGTGHFVAVLSSDGDGVVIGDPLKGRVEIERSELNKYYEFTSFFLVVRRRSAVETLRRSTLLHLGVDVPRSR